MSTSKISSINLRNVIKSLVEQVRECRVDRSIPMIVGQGFTIAKKGDLCSIVREKEGFSFRGTWNRESSYWTKEDATKVAAAIAGSVKDRTGWELEVIHRNDLRDRHEKGYMATIKSVWKMRNL